MKKSTLHSIYLSALTLFGGLTNISKAQTIAGGSFHSLVICSNGVPSNWGIGGGKLGIGVTSGTSTPANMLIVSGITQVAGGNDHTVMLKNDGTAWTCGLNNRGQLGNGNNTTQSSPVQVINLTGLVAVAAGGVHSLFLKNDGTVWAAGYNNSGELGNGTNTNTNTPSQVVGLNNVIAISSMGVCSVALKNDGTVWSWGDNASGQLGIGTTGPDSNVPVQVTGVSNVIAIKGGGAHTLALKNDGTVWAWGYGTDGRLGAGTFSSSNVPVQVSISGNVIALGAGLDGHSMFLKNDGTVWTTGKGTEGRLGIGTTTNINVPVQVSGLTSVVEIAGGFNHSLAKKADGSLWVWGDNAWGQLGDGGTTDALVPQQVTGLCTIVSGLNESSITENVSLYPNPSTGNFKIHMENEGVYTLKAMNMLGEIVTEIPFENDKAVDLQHLHAGMYIINVFESKQLKGITRIVIQN